METKFLLSTPTRAKHLPLDFCLIICTIGDLLRPISILGEYAVHYKNAGMNIPQD